MRKASPCPSGVWTNFSLLSQTSQIAEVQNKGQISSKLRSRMLKHMFGDMQMGALVDMIQSALMLNYNGRKIG